jgi:hypothetical protein
MTVVDVVFTGLGLLLLAVALTVLVTSFFIPPSTRTRPEVSQTPLLDEQLNEQLVRDYPGKWVAVAGPAVLASAESLKDLLAVVNEDEAKLVLKVPAAPLPEG